jgi:hypothetical protein
LQIMYQFFAEFNSKLLSSSNYIIRRQAIQVCFSCFALDHHLLLF